MSNIPLLQQTQQLFTRPDISVVAIPLLFTVDAPARLTSRISFLVHAVVAVGIFRGLVVDAAEPECKGTHEAGEAGLASCLGGHGVAYCLSFSACIYPGGERMCVCVCVQQQQQRDVEVLRIFAVERICSCCTSWQLTRGHVREYNIFDGCCA